MIRQRLSGLPRLMVGLAALAGGLGAGAGQARAATYPRTFHLSGGFDVLVQASGAATLRQGGRDLLATSPDAPITARRFEETLSTIVAQFQFGRQNERAVTFSRFRGATKAGDRVRLRFTSDATSGPERFWRATVTIQPATPGESSRLEVAVKTRRDVILSSIALPVRCDAAGGFHGFGEQYGKTDQRGEKFPLFVSEQGIGRNPANPQLPLNGTAHTTYFPMPYYLDPRGFGALVQSSRRVEVDLCATDPAVAWLEVVSPDPVSLLVLHGPSMLDVIRQLGAAIGRPKPPPAWAYGLWISAQGGRAAVESRVAQILAEEIPATAIWSQDWTGVRVNFDGGLGVQYRWRPDLAHYPDLPGFIDQLHGQGLRFLGYANPFVASNLEHYPEMLAQDLLIRKPDGTPYLHIAPNGLSSEADLTRPAAREYVKAELRGMAESIGMDGWMSDFGEWLPIDAVYADGSDPVVNHDRYPIEWHRLSREVLDEVHPDGDYAVFARSGFTGVHAYSMIHWIGDQETDWATTDGLPTVVPAMLNLGLSGVPYVTHDVGGFSGTTAPPRSKELMLRWIELGAFTPVMRTHEGADRNNNWQWYSDADTIAHLRRFARIHAALAPEFQALGAEAATTSAPIVRHLMLEFPGDPTCATVSDQFLIGTSLLVAPVVEEGATTRAVYLPPGTWYDVWTGTAYTGGTTVVVGAPIGSPPVFSREVDRPDLRAIS